MSTFTAISVFLTLCLWLGFYFFLSDFSFSEIITHRKIMKDNTLPTFATDHPFVTSKFHKLLRSGNYYQAFHHLARQPQKCREDLYAVLEYYVLYDVEIVNRKTVATQLLKNLIVHNKNFKENPLDVYIMLLAFSVDDCQYGEKIDNMNHMNYPCFSKILGYNMDNKSLCEIIKDYLSFPFDVACDRIKEVLPFSNQNTIKVTLLVYEYYKMLINRDISYQNVLNIIEKLEEKYIVLKEQERLKYEQLAEEERLKEEEQKRILEAKQQKKEQKKIIKQLKEELKE